MKPPVTGFILIYLGAVCFGIALGVGYMTIHHKPCEVRLIEPVKYKVQSRVGIEETK